MTATENSYSRRLTQSVLIGLAALALIKAPPIDLGGRLDYLLYDVWMRLGSTAPSSAVLRLELGEVATLPAALEAAERAGISLAVTLVGTPDAAPSGLTLLGPVARPDADGTMLVPSDVWKAGGHLWLTGDSDGVVRRNRAFLRPAANTLPSLSVAALSALVANGAAPRRIDDDLFVGTRRFPMDDEGRVWLRFYPGHPFEPITTIDLAADGGKFAGRTLIIDQAGAVQLATPVGRLSQGALLTHALSGYLEDQLITLGFTPAVGWLILALFLATILLVTPRLNGPILTGVTVITVVTCLGVSATSWWYFNVWLPLAAPATLIIAVSLLATISQRWSPQVLADGGTPAGEDPVVHARRLSARGRLAEAWNTYRRVELDASLLPELYQLALNMERSARYEEARGVFRHMANLDPGFRDIQHRLLEADRLNHKPPEAPAGRRPAPNYGRELPETLGRYEILRELGRGAMGVVYLGRDPRINRPVAIKAIPLADEFDVDYLEEVRDRFFGEAETVGRLIHPNIVTIFDVGEDGDLAYIAMEYLEGSHLSDHAETDQLLPVPVVLEMAARTADGLNYAHRHKVVHRDIKPANIMYDSASDTLKITDFGIARLTDVSRTRTGIVLGTPSFMSPEQLEGKNVNGHTDLFALGVSVYQLLTGQLPFRGASLTKLMFSIANEPHERVSAIRPELPGSLDGIIDRALAKDPQGRFATGAEMAGALRTVGAELG